MHTPININSEPTATPMGAPNTYVTGWPYLIGGSQDGCPGTTLTQEVSRDGCPGTPYCRGAPMTMPWDGILMLCHRRRLVIGHSSSSVKVRQLLRLGNFSCVSCSLVLACRLCELYSQLLDIICEFLLSHAHQPR